MPTPRRRTSLEDIRLGQALLKHRLLSATRLLECTRRAEAEGGSLAKLLTLTGEIAAPVVQSLLDGTYRPASKLTPARPVTDRPAAGPPPMPPAPTSPRGPIPIPPVPETPEEPEPEPPPPRRPVAPQSPIPPAATQPDAPARSSTPSAPSADFSSLDALFDAPVSGSPEPSPPESAHGATPAEAVRAPDQTGTESAAADPPPQEALSGLPPFAAEDRAQDSGERPAPRRAAEVLATDAAAGAPDAVTRMNDVDATTPDLETIGREGRATGDAADAGEPAGPEAPEADGTVRAGGRESTDAGAAADAIPNPPVPPAGVAAGGGPEVDEVETGLERAFAPVSPSPAAAPATRARHPVRHPGVDSQPAGKGSPAEHDGSAMTSATPGGAESAEAAPSGPPRVIDEHFVCLRRVSVDSRLESYAVQHTTDQHYGVLHRLEQRPDLAREVEALRSRAAAVEEFKNPCAERMLGHGTWEGRLYWVEERIEGTPLGEYLRSGPLPAKSAASILADVAEALEEAHAHGLSHDALEADAIVLTPSGRPRLTGFCRPGRSAVAGAGRGRANPGVQADLDAALRVLRQMLEGSSGRGRAADPVDPLDRALTQILRLEGGATSGPRYDSAGRLARDLRAALAGEPVHPPGSSSVWRVLSAMVRWFRFSWLIGLAVLGGVGGFFGHDQYRKWRELQAMDDVDTSIRAYENAMAPYLARGQECLKQGIAALDQGHFPHAGQTLREAAKEFSFAIDLAPRSYLAHPAYMGRARARYLLEDWAGGAADADSALSVNVREMEAHYVRALSLLADLHGKVGWVEAGSGRRRWLEPIRSNAVDSLRREAGRSLDECVRTLSPSDRTQGWGGAAVALHAYLQGRSAEALPLLRQECAKHPENRAIHEALAFLLAGTAPVDHETALGVAGHLIRRVPDHVRAYALRAELHLMRDNPARAQEDIAEAIRRSPEEGWLYEIQAKVHFARGRTDRALADLEHALRIAPESLSARRIAGRILRRLGRWEEALDHLGRALGAGPSLDAEVRLERGAVFEALGRPVEAGAEYARATEADPGRPEAWVGRVRCELARNDMGMAATLIQQAQDLHSGAAGLALALGVVRHSQKDWRGAIRALDKALDLARGEPVEEAGEPAHATSAGVQDERVRWAGLVRWPCPAAGILHLRALCHLGGGAPDLAERDWNSALELEPDFLPALLARCELALENGRSGLALQDARRIVHLQPRSPRALVLRARALERTGELAAAKADLDAALAAAPEDPDASLQRGLLHLTRGNPDDAIRDFDRVVQRFPQWARPWALRAGAESARGNVRRAREDFETALSLDPRLPEAHLGLARLHLDAGRPGDALAALDRALRALPDDTSLRAARADHHVKAGRFAEALKDYDAAVALRPGDPVLLTNRGAACQATGRFDLALADYTRSIELAPEFVAAWLNRGLLHLAEHRLDDARRDLDRALDLRPNFHEAYLARARAREEAGSFPEALSDYSEAIRCRPNAATAYVSRALVRVRLGKDDEARADLERALRIDPSLSSAIAPELKEVLAPRR